MKNIDFIILVEELNKAFEERVKDVITCGYTSQLTIDRYRKDAEVVVLEFEHGSYISDKGKRTNADGRYINEKLELLNSKGERINDDGDIINEKGEVIKKLTYQQIREEIKNRALWINENKIEDRINSMCYLNYNKGLNDLDIDSYLRLSFICHQWGIYQSRLGLQSEIESRKYLYDALMFINMWVGGHNVLRINREIEGMEQERITIAQLGGRSRSEKYMPLKIKIVELLKENVPEGGWKSKTSAIDAIESGINKFIEDKLREFDSVSKGKKLMYYASWDKMHKRISDWSRNDEMIKAAFDEVVKK
ncbi:TPA: hypothetical protein ACPYWN_003179 [Klebsiella oxytoca]|uniref:hypothetical protein n=1 Tax=Klebsiella pneumoniae TaxID=573 RepID=UPI0010722070|nr:hypothetical protein [Klebsiella pneumoniae]QMF81505.1 hypothetical protein HVY73_05720 [Klebsiella pneumoniae]HDT4634420.1 hypothetical protein [Klebsiella pneumoniae]